jgi:hypothetical protein
MLNNHYRTKMPPQTQKKPRSPPAEEDVSIDQWEMREVAGCGMR